jgi:translation initiation factor 1
VPIDRKQHERLVFSTEVGRVCPECQRPQQECSCAAERKAQVLGDGKVRVRRETSGRAGKTVSTISGLAMPEGELQLLLKELKQRCGCGGSLKDGVLEIQGDHCELLLQELGRRGISAKRAGG